VAIAFAFEASPEICDHDLSALVDSDKLAFEMVHVVKAWKIVDKKVDKSSGGAFGLGNTIGETPIKPLEELSLVPSSLSSNEPLGAHSQLLVYNTFYLRAEEVPLSSKTEKYI